MAASVHDAPLNKALNYNSSYSCTWIKVYKQQKKIYGNDKDLKKFFSEIKEADIKALERSLKTIKLNKKDQDKLKKCKERLDIWYHARETLKNYEKLTEPPNINQGFLFIELVLYTIGLREIYFRVKKLLENKKDNKLLVFFEKEMENLQLLRNALTHFNFEFISNSDPSRITDIKFYPQNHGKNENKKDHLLANIGYVSLITHNVYRLCFLIIWSLENNVSHNQPNQ